MKHPERVEDYLEHISQMIEYATSFIEDVNSVNSLKTDFKTQAAIVHCIEIIGEAANKISATRTLISLRITRNCRGVRCATCGTNSFTTISR